jgi:hypothetical protein
VNELILYSTFEEMKSHLHGTDINTRLMELIEPLPDMEEEINIIARTVTNAGKLLFILGKPGTGKSTFLQSLTWKRHIRIQNVNHIDATNYIESGLSALFGEIKKYQKESIEKKDAGPTCIIIDYLESIDDFDESEVKGFFRSINGLLRTTPLFILWPVTNKDDVDLMLSFSIDVSGTLFYRGHEVLPFNGPHFSKFKDIIIRTISTLNDGKDLTEFSLTFDDLSEIDKKLEDIPVIERTMREYIELIKEKWRHNSDYQARIRSQIPKSTEVWFIFCYRDAEGIVSQFARRSDRIEDNWTVIHDKLYEYIRTGQRSAVWSAQRLQMALYGSIKTRLLFMPTNTLMSCVYSYSDNKSLQKQLKEYDLPSNWKEKHKAKRTLMRTAIFKQIIGEVIHAGMRRGGPAADSLERAEPAFNSLVKWISVGPGSDKPVNNAIAMAIKECTGLPIVSDISHPWIPNIIPDIFIDLQYKQICLEFHYTNQNEPYIIADYVLKKLNSYMNELEALVRD